ncbi:MAG: hypothetical protein IJK04_00725 [Kiritimatiellae bacterium]|nr:hypothetical protein [Kiritimatiellia bacterium]
MENILQSWLDESLPKDANDAQSAAEMLDLFALAKGIPDKVVAFLFNIRQAGTVGRSNAEENLDEFDHLNWGFPEGVLAILKKPGKSVSPRQKAFAWLHYVRSMETVRHLAALSLLKTPGCDDFRNLSRNAFSTVSARPDGRTRVEPFLCGRMAGPRETLAFLGAAAIERMDFLPESLERPFGPRERLVSDAICDRSLPKATRARLLCSVGNDRAFDGLLPVEARDVPLGFLDSKAGRKWYCENGRPGFEIVRCSDPAFFKNVAREDWSSDVDLDKVKIDPKLRKAIDADSPAQLMMQLSVSGKNVDARLLAVILTLRKTKILEWLLENDAKTKELLDERRMLFYVCANWDDEHAAAWLEKADAKQPGVIKSCVDTLGRNLLWYTQYNWRHGGAEETLLRHGCDPDAETVWGLSWRDMKEAW